MKQILLAFSLMILYSANAQNYQTIKSNQINYFGTNDLSYILATRTDSVKLSGLDSVFYSYKTVRENDTATSEACANIVGANWYGDKVVIKANGDNLFFNKNLDTICIKTQAALGDTFLVYVYPGSADSIYGWVSNIFPLIIFGVPDVIKTIDLFSTSNLNITDPQILIGENYGFIEFFAPYSFPEPYSSANFLTGYTDNFNLVGHEFPRTGITKPLVGEIYDFEIGDRFIYEYGSQELMSSYWFTNYYKERIVIDKYFGADSIYYVVHDTIKYTEGYDSEILNTNYYGFNQTIIITNLLSLYDSLLPEEINMTNGDSWNYLGVNNYCGRLQQTYYTTSIGFANGPENPCLEFYSLSSGSESYVASVGLGILPAPYGFEYGYAVYNSSYLLYYSKVLEDTCGTNSYMALDDFSKTTPSFLVYPNPTSVDATIRLNVEPTSNYQITISDLSGKIIYAEILNADLLLNGYVLPTSQLQSGIYLIVLSDGENRFVEKLVKE